MHERFKLGEQGTYQQPATSVCTGGKLKSLPLAYEQINQLSFSYYVSYVGFITPHLGNVCH